MTTRERRARQMILAADTVDAWEAKFEKYRTTVDSCKCPDHMIRGARVGPSKHMLALRLLAERQEAQP